MIVKTLRSQIGSPAAAVHPKTLIEMWITCLDPVSTNSEKGKAPSNTSFLARLSALGYVFASS